MSHPVRSGLSPQAPAGGTGSVRAVEGKQPWGQLGIRDAALDTGKLQAEDDRLASIRSLRGKDLDLDHLLAKAGPPFKRIGQTLFDSLPDRQPIHDQIDLVTQGP